MEFFLTTGAAGSPTRKERFPDLGAALERAVEVVDAGGAVLELTDTGERRLLRQAELERLARLVGKFTPVDDGIASQVFGSLPDATLDDLFRWLIVRMRSAGTSPRARLALLGSILDAISSDV